MITNSLKATRDKQNGGTETIIYIKLLRFRMVTAI